MTRESFWIVVGNIGTVYNGVSATTAHYTFDFYVRSSKNGIGRASNEPVALFKGENIIREHFGIDSED